MKIAWPIKLLLLVMMAAHLSGCIIIPAWEIDEWDYDHGGHHDRHHDGHYGDRYDDHD